MSPGSLPNGILPPKKCHKRPKIIIELNGGISSINECIKTLETFDGAMVGRAAYSHTYICK